MHRKLSLVSLLAAAAVLTGCATSMKMGEPMKEPMATMTVSDLMDAKSDHVGKPVRVEGFVTALCDGEPYFELAAEKNEDDMDDVLLVMFDCSKCKCEIPAEAKGKKAVVEGKLVMYEMSAEALKHYSEQKGMSKEDAAKIKKARKVAKVEASYAEIQGVAAPAEKAEKKDACCGSAECKSAGKCVGEPKKADAKTDAKADKKADAKTGKN